MQHKETVKAISWGLTFLLALTANIGAYCPSVDGTTISCNNCTPTLTCNYSGSITISGSNVTLDGDSHVLTPSSGNGLYITGASATVLDLFVFDAPSSCVVIDGGGATTLSGVWVEGCGSDGVSASSTDLTIDVLYSGSNTAGVSVSSNNLYSTDMSYSTLEDNESGYIGYQQNNSDHTENYYMTSSSNSGANDSYGDGGSYTGNIFIYNHANGLYVHDRSGDAIDLVDNEGYGNGGWDCQAANVNAMNVNGNSWTSNNGCNDI
jgi:hypothetical protein